MNKPKLYTTPFIVVWIMLVVGLLGAFNLAYIPLFIEDYDGMDGGFAFMVIGIFIVIISVIVFATYGKLNSDFKKMLAGDTLLSFVMPFDIYRFFSQKETEDIKGNNKIVLFMILGFCVLFGAILGIVVDPLFILICLGIAVFFTIIFFITTSFRTNKVKKSQSLVCLNMGGAYVLGQIHSWSMSGTWPLSVSFFDGVHERLPCPCIQVTYMAPNYPVPQQHTVTIPVLPQIADQACWAVNAIRSAYHI